MILISLYASPGSGKSVTAAYLFQFFKNRGIDCELIREYPKDLVYAKRGQCIKNQVSILGEQYKRQKDLMDYGVPIAITDSPLPLGLVYSKDLPYFQELAALTWKLNNEFSNINVFINRTKPYNPSGRIQTEEESDKFSAEIKNLVNFDYVIDGNEMGQSYLANQLLTILL